MSSVNDAAKVISNNIKALREAAGWNQARLAQEAGISGAALSKIEQGETRIPTMVVLQRLASALKVDLSEITGVVPATRDERAEQLSAFYRKFGVLEALQDQDQRLILEMAERVRALQATKGNSEK